jgi:hypothetical protein
MWSGRLAPLYQRSFLVVFNLGVFRGTSPNVCARLISGGGICRNATEFVIFWVRPGSILRRPIDYEPCDFGDERVFW